MLPPYGSQRWSFPPSRFGLPPLLLYVPPANLQRAAGACRLLTPRTQRAARARGRHAALTVGLASTLVASQLSSNLSVAISPRIRGFPLAPALLAIEAMLLESSQ